MTTDTVLIEKREELKRRLAAGEYKTLVDVFLGWFERLLRKVTRRTTTIPLWITTIILSLFSTLLGFAALYISGELLPTYDAFKGLGLTFGTGTLWLIMLNSVNITSTILINRYIQRIFVLWHDEILDKTESIESLDSFESWLGKACNRRIHFLIAIAGGIFLSIYVMAVSTLNGIQFRYGSILGLFIIDMIVSVSIYSLWVAILLSIALSQYSLKLFPTDPSSSELVARLSSTLGILVYVIAFSGAITALLTILSRELLQILGIAQVLLGWLPLVIIFFLNQTSLSSIIRRAKWKTLNEIQSQVEELRTSKNLKDKETMEAINRLMDFHDRVKATRNSAINSNTILNFINSLLLPLLAFLLGNLDKVLLLLSRKP